MYIKKLLYHDMEVCFYSMVKDFDKFWVYGYNGETIAMFPSACIISCFKIVDSFSDIKSLEIENHKTVYFTIADIY